MSYQISPLTIYWQKINAATFLYGTTLTYNKDGSIQFENNLMAPSTIIHEWHSHGVYQAKRVISPLPLLIPNKQYELIANMTTFPQNSIFIGIRFYDRYEKELDFIILKETTNEFKVPNQTYQYCIQLINAGCHRIEFNHLTLKEII